MSAIANTRISHGVPPHGGTFLFSEIGFLGLQGYGLTNVKRYDRMTEEKSVIRQKRTKTEVHYGGISNGERAYQNIPSLR